MISYAMYAHDDKGWFSSSISSPLRYVSWPVIDNLKQVQKLLNVETFGLENIQFLANSMFCQF